MNTKYASLAILLFLSSGICFASQPSIGDKRLATQELILPKAKKAKKDASTQQNTSYAHNASASNSSSSASSANSVHNMGEYYIKIDVEDPNPKIDQQILIELFKIDKPKSIGKASSYYTPEKRIYLSTFFIDKEYRKLHLGSYLFKYAIAYLKNNFNEAPAEWCASPPQRSDIPNDNAPHKQRLQQLIKFYCDQGAIDNENATSDSTMMHYPLPRAQMLVALMPILEPALLSKKDKQMILANGAAYQASPSNALGIIANYMSENNE